MILRPSFSWFCATLKSQWAALKPIVKRQEQCFKRQARCCSEHYARYKDVRLRCAELHALATESALLQKRIFSRPQQRQRLRKRLRNVTASRRNVHYCTNLPGKRLLGQERILFTTKKDFFLPQRKIFFYHKKDFFGEGSETVDSAASLANFN